MNPFAASIVLSSPLIRIEQQLEYSVRLRPILHSKSEKSDLSFPIRQSDRRCVAWQMIGAVYPA